MTSSRQSAGFKLSSSSGILELVFDAPAELWITDEGSGYSILVSAVLVRYKLSLGQGHAWEVDLLRVYGPVFYGEHRIPGRVDADLPSHEFRVTPHTAPESLRRLIRANRPSLP
jgi:hypothetical protein